MASVIAMIAMLIAIIIATVAILSAIYGHLSLPFMAMNIAILWPLLFPYDCHLWPLLLP